MGKILCIFFGHPKIYSKWEQWPESGSWCRYDKCSRCDEIQEAVICRGIKPLDT